MAPDQRGDDAELPLFPVHALVAAAQRPPTARDLLWRPSLSIRQWALTFITIYR